MSNRKPNRSDYDFPERDDRTGRSAAAARIAHQTSWVDEQIRVAMEKGEFDNLPGAGKPIPGLGGAHDPDWWIKKLVERENITGVLPASLQLRKDDAALDERLDGVLVEREVREVVEEFNERVIHARYSLQQGPPLITMPRDVDETVEAWRERRAARRRSQPRTVVEPTAQPRRWWQRKARG